MMPAQLAEQKHSGENKVFLWVGLFLFILAVSALAFWIGKMAISGPTSATPTGAVVGTNESSATSFTTSEDGTSIAGSTVELPLMAREDTIIVMGANKSLDSYSGLMLATVSLRESQKQDVLRTAKLVTIMESTVAALDVPLISNKWELVSLCVAQGCTNEQFYEFLLVVSTEAEHAGVPRATLVINLLTANKYWNTDNVVRFSESLTASDAGIKRVNTTASAIEWQALLDCNGNCAEKDSILFKLITATLTA